MAAPILRYSDHRLYGHTLTQPFNRAYAWTRTAANPWHYKSDRITECAIRAMKLFTGALALMATCLPALLGRAIQIIHFHAKSASARKTPTTFAVDNTHLPTLRPCTMRPKVFHGTQEQSAINILRWGFDLQRTAVGSIMGAAVYVSADDAVSGSYGKDQLVLKLDLLPEEIAELSTDPVSALGHTCNTPELMATVQYLFYLNGYRAIKYPLNHYGTTEAWAVYDPSCITISGINPSPTAPVMVN